LIKIKNETGSIIELNFYTDANNKSIFEQYETMEFESWDDFNPMEMIVYGEGKAYISNGYNDIYNNEICEIYVD